MGDELRIALVMNGGVSLAVWIGGVVAEFGRMVARRPDGPYDRLLALLDWSPRIDVIAGTSAGGVNGAYLALALKRLGSQDLEQALTKKLREVWIEDGAIDQLLRNPGKPSAPSVLDGDGFYYQHLRAAFTAIAQGTTLPLSMDLILTATLLTGKPQDLADDYGSGIPDVTHRALFHFRSDRGAARDGDDFARPLIGDRLAVAARSTSSFPGAFEPSFCPISENATNPTIPAPAPASLDASGRPYLDDIADFKQSRFLVDGGVLDNKPLDVALDCMFGKASNGPARRVLAYVFPHPGTVTVQPPDDAKATPELIPVVFASTVGIPSVQSVANDIERLRDHNDRVRKQRDGRALVTRHAPPARVDDMASALFPSYRDMCLARALDEIVDGLNTGLAKAGAPTLGKSRKEWLRTQIFEHATSIRWIPDESPLSRKGKRERQPDDWAWGTRSVVYLSRFALDLLVRLEKSLVVRSNRAGTEPLWTEVSALIKAADKARATDEDFWQRPSTVSQARVALDSGSAAALETADFAWLSALLASWRRDAEPRPGDLALRIASFVIGLRRRFGELDAQGYLAESATSDIRSDLQSILEYIVREPEPSSAAVLERLLAFMVVDQTLGGQQEQREQVVDFIQISGNDDALTGSGRSADQKLTGTQLANFGAFYKPSWRANDWIWGRRDALPRIMRILLDPTRIAKIGRELDATDPGKALLDGFETVFAALDADEPNHGFAKLWREESPTIAAELAFINQNLPVPDALPCLTKALTKAFELDILRSELILLAQQIRDDRDDGMKQSNAGRDIVNVCGDAKPGERLPLERVLQLDDEPLLGGESWAQEVGTDPATLTIAKALAVFVTTFRGDGKSASPLGGASALLRLPTMFVYGIASSLRAGSRTVAAAIGAAFAAALVIVLTSLFSPYHFSKFILGPAWAVIAAGIVVALLRARGARIWWSIGLLVAIAAAVFVAWKLPSVSPALSRELNQPIGKIALVESVMLVAIVTWNLFSPIGWIRDRLHRRRLFAAAKQARLAAAPPSPPLTEPSAGGNVPGPGIEP